MTETTTMHFASPISLLRGACRIGFCAALVGVLAVVPPATADTLTVLHTFDSRTGAGPAGRLVQGSDGRFYGVTVYGGSHNTGTIYAVAGSGGYELLQSFDDDLSPAAGLVEFGTGNFYGTTYRIDRTGTQLGGTIFRVNSAGMLQTLHTFEVHVAASALVDGRDGWLYGTTQADGSGNLGTVFKMAPDGTFVTLHQFTAAEGAGPSPLGLTLASDGKFYGALATGPNGGNEGAIFSITPAGTVSIVHVFNGADGIGPVGGLVEAPAGTFYGAAYSGGPGNAGSLFRLTADGGFTILHGFDDTAADGPVGVTLGPDGSVYGLTNRSASVGSGSIFRMTPGGATVALRLLNPARDGGAPNGQPIFGSDGLLYGVNNGDGPKRDASGTVFKFDALAPQAPQLAIECGGGVRDKCRRAGQVRLEWNSSNLDTCEASGAWSGTRAPSGGVQFQPPPGRYVYGLTCTGPGGAKSASATAVVF